MNSSRRKFLAAGVSLPAVATASRFTPPEPQAKPQSQKPKDALAYRVLGKTGLKVTTVGFGCMITSDGSVIERAADMGINYFDTARGYSQGNNERMVGAALKGKRDRKSTRLNSSHQKDSYAGFCLKKKKIFLNQTRLTRPITSGHHVDF